MLFTVVILTLIVFTLQEMQVDFERFEPISGFDYYTSTIRVRKYNRTVVTINGTFELLQPLNKSFIISSDFFHSRLGNQQFNHYPMKFPTQDVCQYINSMYTDYRKHLENVINLPDENECPIAPRIVAINNKVFPTKAVPPFFPAGLWKALTMISLNGVEVARFELIIKAKNDFI